MNRDKDGREIERVTDITIIIRGHYGIDLCKAQLLAILEAHREWFLDAPSAMVVRKSMDPQGKLADLAATRLLSVQR
jgi:hypothetical protein